MVYQATVGNMGDLDDAEELELIAIKILGNEDDVVIELCFNLIEGTRFVCFLDSLSAI